MKQASFKIDKINKIDKIDKIYKINKIDKIDKIDTMSEHENKFVTSKKPVKHVENIYYFKS